MDRLIAETHIDKAAGIHNRTEFAYDKAGNLVEITDNQGGSRWSMTCSTERSGGSRRTAA